MNTNKTIKECRMLANAQNLTFKRSQSVGLINGKACYEIESGIQYKILSQGCLSTVYNKLLSESCANQ